MLSITEGVCFFEVLGGVRLLWQGLFVGAVFLTCYYQWQWWLLIALMGWTWLRSKSRMVYKSFYFAQSGDYINNVIAGRSYILGTIAKFL